MVASISASCVALSFIGFVLGILPGVHLAHQFPAEMQWFSPLYRQVAQAGEEPPNGKTDGSASEKEESAEPGIGADETTSDETATPDETANAAKSKTPSTSESLFKSMIMILPLGLLFYLMMIRPQQKKSAEAAAMMEKMKNLKKGDRVVTVGGIVGQIVNSQKDSDQVTLLIDDATGAKLRVMRTHLARVVNESDKGNDKSKTDKAPVADLTKGDV